MRCFIAIDTPPEVREEISKVQDNLPDVKMKKVDPDNAHITLKFLGDLREGQVKDVKEILKRKNFKKFKLFFDKIGVFNPDFIKVVWLGLKSEGGEIFRLVSEIEEKMKDIVGEKKNFYPHVTIARVNNLSDMGKEEYISKIKNLKVKPCEFIVDNIKLKKSDLDKGGPVYSDLYIMKLD